VNTETPKFQKMEIEIKIKIGEHPGMREKILDSGFKCVAPFAFERNIVFDTVDSRLKKNKCLLRLREIDHKNTLTFKHPPQIPISPDLQTTYKILGEIETQVSDFKSTQAILHALGFEEFFIYEKYREIFDSQHETGTGKIMLDHTPIGNFIEIEGDTGEIDKIASLLGFSHKDYITANYYTLYRAEHPYGHMQFSS